MYTLRYYLMYNCTQLFNVLCLRTFTAGLFVFSNGCIVVVENLSDGQQRHLTGRATSLVLRGTFNSFEKEVLTASHGPVVCIFHGSMASFLALPVICHTSESVYYAVALLVCSRLSV